MERNFIHINGIKYDAIKVVEELISNKELWKIKGLEFLIQLMDASDIPVKFHTSGTTGVPKEISFYKSQILKSAQNTNEYFELDSSNKMLLCLPAEFVAGRLMMVRAMMAGAELKWVKPSLNPLLEVNDIDFAAFTPAQISAILNDPRSKKNLEKIKQIIIGGGEVPQTLIPQLKWMSNSIFVTYGMTETLTHVAVRLISDEIFHSVYEDLVFSVTEEQCLVINLPFISKEPIITHDIVELVDKHSFKLKGRLDHVINSGGVKLHPELMEEKLISLGVLQPDTFYISSQAHEQFGQSPVIVMLKEVEPQNSARFLERINGLLNKREAVKAVIIFDKFEYTDSGKLKREKFN
jgi:O-succinylbenzoic acid--CoA ligase